MAIVEVLPDRNGNPSALPPPAATVNSALHPLIHWTEAQTARVARWRSESGHPAPKRVVIADDRLSADAAYRIACAGTALLWRGDFQNARQLLQALDRRTTPKPRKQAVGAPITTVAESFHLHRQAQAKRARTLGMLLIPLEADYGVPLRRAPDLRLACEEAYGAAESDPSVASLRELLGLISAHEWRRKGVPIPALNDRIHPHYGVFAPIRSEYLGLVADAPLPALTRAFDIGTGTGVLAAILARRGVAQIVATDTNPRALACARENIARLGMAAQVDVVATDMFPPGRAPLVVCNPPWLPTRPSSTLEQAVYDPDSRMLLAFIAGLADHLEPGGEGWLVLSDLAEHLGLRTRAELLTAFTAAGLKIIARHDARPTHPRASDATDPLHAARAAEITSLWRLAVEK